MKKLMVLIAALLTLASSQAIAENGHSWYRSFEEVVQLYEEHYNRESRLENYIHELGDGKYVADISFESREEWRVMVPPSFIQHILNHLELALEKGWANYIFWPDLNHGHLFISREYWQEKYSEHTDPTDKYLTRMLEEDEAKMGILYHAAEHFCRLDPANEEAIRTRNIVGWFDGRPIELVYPDPKTDKSAHIRANTAGDPEGMDRKWFISVSAGKNGYFAIYPNGEEIRLDISFRVLDVYDSTKYGKESRETIF